jgi:drug/metabolite transporter superfamily protein YnfA
MKPEECDVSERTSTTLLTVNKIFQTHTHIHTHKRTYTIYYKLFAVYDMMWKSVVFHQQSQFVYFYNQL